MILEPTPSESKKVDTVDFLASVGTDIDRINHALKNDLVSEVPLINKLSDYLIQSGGKRLRPLLTIFSGRLCHIDVEKSLNIAIIFEYLHGATLLHDDVVDNADMRRGHKAANSIWGNNVAVLVGDYLLGKALLNATDTKNIKIMALLARTACGMSEGEILQLQRKGKMDLSEEEYFTMVRKKTAELLAAACLTGAFLADAEERQEQALYNYGINLGVAFQIIDDTLDYISTEDIFGKAPYKDIQERKVTLPLIRALNQCTIKERKKVDKIFKKKELKNKDLRLIKQLIQSHRGIEYAVGIARDFTMKAKECLQIFPKSPARLTMERLADYIVDRKF